MPTPLIQKLEGGGRSSTTSTTTTTTIIKNLEKQCENEIRELHKLFVTWFRGERPVNELENDLCQRLVPSFSHVAPNGHMVKGRAVLLQYLTDKYGCYQDRVFSIDVYNVQLLWHSGTKCLASYEEWQSWDNVDDDDDDDDDEEDDDNNNNDTNNPSSAHDDDDDDDEDPTENTESRTSKNGGGGTTANNSTSGGKQQFGRLSTCLLEKDKKDGRFRWIHVHETWLEAEEPIIVDDDGTNNDQNTVSGEETVMTGPVPPSEIAKRLAKQQQHQQQQQVPAIAVVDSPAGTSSLLGSESVHSTDEQPLLLNNNTSADDTKAISRSIDTNNNATSTTQQAISVAVASTDGTPSATVTSSSSSSYYKPIIVLISKQSLSKEQIEQQQSCVDILQKEVFSNNNEEYDNTVQIIDGTNPTERTQRNELLDISNLKGGTYPQIFTTTTRSSATGSETEPVVSFWGTYEDFVQAHTNGTLLDSFGLGSSSSNSNNNNNNNNKDGTAAAAVAAAVATTDLPSSDTRRTPFHDYEDSMKALESTAVNDNNNINNNNDEDDNNNASMKITEVTPVSPVSPSGKQKSKTRRALLVATNEPPPVDPEKDFLERSQGILEFEDEDDNSNNNVDDVPNSNGTHIGTDTGNIKSGEETGGETSSTVVKLESLVSPPDASKKRHVSLKMEKYAKPLVWENALVGISIKGFDIGTSQGVVADSIWHSDTTQQLESLAQSFSIPIPKRRLCLPEMIYPTAHVALEGYGIWLSWDATDALEAWAKCHQMIAVKSRISWEGVNVLKTQDAKLWEQKAAAAAAAAEQTKKKNLRALGTSSSHSKDSDDEGGNSGDGTTKPASVFHYDWTFSTPFIVKAEGGEWIELDESGMRTELLKDQSVPILFFDEIILYEDDLHDNGIVQYSIKLRVMPTCAYILARLFVRVDNVIVRLRETRVLIDFFGLKPQIYRDITWKECHWDQLKDHNLPTDIKSWTISDSAPPQKVQEWQRLVQQLPEVRLPKNYYQYATFEF